MSWAAALLALLISHVVGDVMLQTEWQAATKSHGLREPEGRRALISHVVTYMLAFIPALVWIGTQISAPRAVAVGVVVAIPHLLIDDGSLVRVWLRDVKRAPAPTQALMIAVDQCFHLLCLLGAALVAAG
jgi:Protein of unknown function (DUF3307)